MQPTLGTLNLDQGFLNGTLGPLGGHEQRPLPNNSAVICKLLLMSRGPQVLRVFGRGPKPMKI